MTKTEILKLEQLVLKYITKDLHKDKTHSALASFIIEDNDTVYLSHSSVRRYVSALRVRQELNSFLLDTAPEPRDTVDVTVEPELAPPPTVLGATTPFKLSPVSIIDDSFHLNYIKTTFVLQITLVDRIYCAYTKKGLNLSGPKVQHMLNLTSDQFKAVVYRLGLTKEDNPYTAYSKETLDETALYAMLSVNVSFLLNLVYSTDGTTTTEITKAYKEALILMQNKELQFQGLFGELKKLLPKVKVTPITPASIKKKSKNVIHLIIPDMHIGLVQDNYNLSIVASKLQYLSNLVSLATNIHVSFMGDIIHSVTGLNHKDSWKNMDAASSGANAIIQPYELLLNFLAGIEGLTQVNIVGGNHDRLANDRSVENTAEGAKLIAYMLKSSLDIPVQFSPNHVTDDTDKDLCLTIMHGDYPLDKESVQTLSWDLGNPAKFNYILTAHTHGRKQEPKNDGLRYRKETLPAFCPGDDYAKTLSTGTLPGCKLIIIDDMGLPLTTDIPLNYG